jgi:hypothetical protein
VGGIMGSVLQGFWNVKEMFVHCLKWEYRFHEKKDEMWVIGNDYTWLLCNAKATIKYTYC